MKASKADAAAPISVSCWGRLKQHLLDLKKHAQVVYLASRDRRTPWYAKAIAGLAVAYALNPIDLIPDFIPVLGYLDDLLIVPAGMALAIKLIPKEVMAEARQKAEKFD